jgi:hypothetical protein
MRPFKRVLFRTSGGDALWMRNTSTAKTPGPIEVQINGTPRGRVDLGDAFRPSPGHERGSSRVVAELGEFVKDPAHWVRVTLEKENVCAICGRSIRTERSRLRGMGPKCATRFALAMRQAAA